VGVVIFSDLKLLPRLRVCVCTGVTEGSLTLGSEESALENARANVLDWLVVSFTFWEELNVDVILDKKLFDDSL
jgi:hypothetical protein